jgi:hypothetical protein
MSHDYSDERCLCQAPVEGRMKPGITPRGVSVRSITLFALGGVATMENRA